MDGMPSPSWRTNKLAQESLLTYPEYFQGMYGMGTPCFAVSIPYYDLE